MYYMMICQDPEVGYLATLDYDFSEDPDPLRDWMSADRFDEPPPLPVRLRVEPLPNTVLAEFWQVPLPVMSKRLHTALLAAGVSNIDIYPAVLERGDSAVVDDTYLAFNIIGKVAAVVAKGGKPGDVLLMGVTLDPALARGALMFRLAESVNAIVVHESVKRAIEGAGIDTLTFLAPEDWTG
ncbi:MAG: hypothetical protein HGA75_09450 [Thiobacillus sp.]|nr:hypothetical protein [Thiobacillus sp.]